MERVIVTGASGFIGRNFIKFLSQKNIEIYAIDRNESLDLFENYPNVYVICNELANISELEQLIPKKEYDAFYHFAWSGTTGGARADYALQSVNAVYTCDAARVFAKLNDGRGKFITTGTITEKVAENILTKHYQSENLMYGLAKLYTHNLLDIVCHKENLQYVWAKLSNIYGGDNVNGNLISYTMKEIKAGNTPSYGPCEQPYNFTHIDDVLEALYLLGNTPTEQSEYFISNGECRKLKEYLQEVAEVCDAKVGIGLRADDGVRYNEEWFDNAALCSLGYQPKYTFSEGLREIIK